MNVGDKIMYDELASYTSKLELGVLAFIWCSGTSKQKSKFLFQLANPCDEYEIQWSDDELKFIFLKILQFSTDLPLRYFEQTPEFTIEEIINEEIKHLENLDEKYSEYFYDWFIDVVFPENSSSTTMA